MRARDQPLVGDDGAELRERLRAPVAVLVDRVAADLERAGPDRRVAVVAVAGLREAVGVAVEVRVVATVAVLVDAVVEHLRRAGADRGHVVVAVHRGAEPVEVLVDPGLALGDDVDEVVVGLVVAAAAGDALRVAVARLDRVVAGLAEVFVDPDLALQGVVARPAGEDVGAVAGPELVVAVAARDADRDAQAGRPEDVVARAQVDREARADRARDRVGRVLVAIAGGGDAASRAGDDVERRRVLNLDVVRRREVVDDRDDAAGVAVDDRAERPGGEQREGEGSDGDGEKSEGHAHGAHPLRIRATGATGADAGGRAIHARPACACRILLHRDPFPNPGLPSRRVHPLLLRRRAPSNDRPLVSDRTPIPAIFDRRIARLMREFVDQSLAIEYRRVGASCNALQAARGVPAAEKFGGTAASRPVETRCR